MQISGRILLRMRNVSDNSCRENQNKHFLFIFFVLNSAFYEITWKNIVETDRPQMTIWRMRIACWVTEATDTHSEYVILIALSRQQWSHEHSSSLRYTYIACLSIAETVFTARYDLILKYSSDYIYSYSLNDQ
jgi:hypothetical protein